MSQCYIAVKTAAVIAKLNNSLRIHDQYTVEKLSGTYLVFLGPLDGFLLFTKVSSSMQAIWCDFGFELFFETKCYACLRITFSGTDEGLRIFRC